MTVLEFPPRESWSSLVSLEFLYGIWVLFPSTKAEITFPRVERDRLICVASFNLWPVAPVLACLSDPYVTTKKGEKNTRVLNYNSKVKLKPWPSHERKLLLKLVNNSSILILNNRNHNHDGIWLSDLNEHIVSRKRPPTMSSLDFAYGRWSLSRV